MIFTKKLISFLIFTLFVTYQLFCVVPSAALAASKPNNPPVNGNNWVYGNISSSGAYYNTSGTLVPPGTMAICASVSSCGTTGDSAGPLATYIGQTGNQASFTGLAEDGSTPITINISNVCTDTSTGSISATGDFSAQTISISGYQAAYNNAVKASAGTQGFYPICNTSTSYTAQQITVTANYTNIPIKYGGTIGPVNFSITPQGQAATSITAAAQQMQPEGTVNQASLSAATPSPLPPGNYTVCAPSIQGDPCNSTIIPASFTAPITITFTGNPTSDTLNSIVSPSSAASAASPELQCTLSIINPLTWLVCPIIAAAEGFVGQLDSAINDLLNVSVGAYLDQSNDTGASFYQAWNTFRAFALGLIVVASLIMIIAQAIGVEAVSAYSIRKILPRLLIAIIAISLSWDLMKFFIQFSDDIGHGISGIIYAPFNGAVTKINSGAISGLAIASAGGLLALGIVGALSFVLTAAIAVLVGFATLVLRKILILTLVILAPIAIACAILPNTQKAWKLWSDNFMRALIMFPLIAGFIALGRVFAVIAGSGGSGLEDDIIKLVAWFGPYFMIPATFKMAGGIMGSVGSFASNVSSKARQPLAGFRKNRAADRYKRGVNESLFNKTTKRGQFGNKVATWAFAPHKNLAYHGRNLPGLSGTGQKLAASLQKSQVQQSAELLKELNETGMFNDKAYRALSGAHSGFNGETQRKLREAGIYGKAPTSMEDINTMARILSESDSETERIGANALQGSAGRLASLYSDPEMGYASVQAAGIMGLSSHGFASASDIAGVANAMASAPGGSKELAAAIASRAQVMGQQQRPDVKAGYGVLADKDGTFSSVFEAGNEGRAEALMSTIKLHDWMGAKSGAITDSAATLRRIATETEAGQDANGNVVQVPTARALATQDIIAQGSSQFSSSDPSAKVEWRKIMADIPGLANRVQQVDARRVEIEEVGGPQDHGGGGENPFGL